MKKIFFYIASSLALFVLPLAVAAKFYSDDVIVRHSGMPAAGMIWAHLLAVVVVGIWGIVGVLAAIWLWQNIKHK